jgi:glycosyltransferase involved in cell wall biosynthesis
MGAKVVVEPFNQISRARNTGARVAQGEWLLFIDADSYPSPELIAETLDIIHDGRYVGCGSTVLVKDGTLFNKLRIERLNPIFRFFKLSGDAYLLCHKTAFQAITGFSTVLYAYEEIDFVIRLKMYGRKAGKKFAVLHRHPVITSGRKGEYKFTSMLPLIASNFLAVILFILHYFLPKGLVTVIGARFLGYWYDRR